MKTEFIEIKNYKSIQSLTLSQCRRINLLIGPPNVGKSNILEALSLFDLPFRTYDSGFDEVLKSTLRIERPQQIFPFGNYGDPVEIQTSEQSLKLSLDTTKLKPDLNLEIICKTKGETIKEEIPDVFVYFYPKHFRFKVSPFNFLKPPYGDNLMQVIKDNPSLIFQLREILNFYGFESVYDSNSEEFRAMKQDGKQNVYMIPFTALADSIKHLFFYKAAIESNEGKIICFEEPEANTFPPYVSNLVQTLVDHPQNQYFISTHSPLVVNDLLENALGEVAIYKIGIKDGFTDVYRLQENEVQTAFDYGMDFFFNIEAFPLKTE